MQIYVEQFLFALAQQNRSVRTVAQYGWHLQRFAAYCAERGVVSPADVSRSLLREWGAGLHAGWSPATVKIATTAVRSFLRWLAEELEEPDRLSSALKPPRVPQKASRHLSAADVTQLLMACDGSPRGIRDAALVALLVDSGLRRREVVALQANQVDLTNGCVPVVRKGGDTGLGWFGYATAERLRLWLAVRPQVVRPDVPELFVAIGGLHPGCALTPEGLRGVLRHLGERAGVPHLHPHLFRHTMATLRIEGGDSTRTVQAVGGWSNLALVEHYSAGVEVHRLARRHAPMDGLDPGMVLQLPLPLSPRE